jgi:hypothetical protein
MLQGTDRCGTCRHCAGQPRRASVIWPNAWSRGRRGPTGRPRRSFASMAAGGIGTRSSRRRPPSSIRRPPAMRPVPPSSGADAITPSPTRVVPPERMRHDRRSNVHRRDGNPEAARQDARADPGRPCSTTRRLGSRRGGGLRQSWVSTNPALSSSAALAGVTAAQHGDGRQLEAAAGLDPLAEGPAGAERLLGRPGRLD